VLDILSKYVYNINIMIFTFCLHGADKDHVNPQL
jgi:hypothetical protein